MEDSNGSVVVDDNRSNSNKKFLIVLCTLMAAIVGLVISIVVINLKTEGGESLGDTGNSDNNSNDNEYSLMIKKTFSDFENVLSPEEISARAEEIYDNNPENAPKVIDYFVGLTREDPTDDVKINYAAWGLWIFFARLNDHRSLIDGMTQIDVSTFNDLDKHAWYQIIISSADVLGDEEVKATYEPLMNSVQYSFDAYTEIVDSRNEWMPQYIEEQRAANKDELDAYWERVAGEKNKEGTE